MATWTGGGKIHSSRKPPKNEEGWNQPVENEDYWVKDANKDQFGFGTEASEPSREQIASYFLDKYSFNDEAFTEKLTDFLSTPYKDDKDIGDARMVLKAIFPESGLIKKEHKKTGKKQIVATWSGEADEEGIKKFESYRRIQKELFLAKGIPSELWTGGE